MNLSLSMYFGEFSEDVLGVSQTSLLQSTGVSAAALGTSVDTLGLCAAKLHGGVQTREGEGLPTPG